VDSVIRANFTSFGVDHIAILATNKDLITYFDLKMTIKGEEVGGHSTPTSSPLDVRPEKHRKLSY